MVVLLFVDDAKYLKSACLLLDLPKCDLEKGRARTTKEKSGSREAYAPGSRSARITAGA
jgi:hypothetical protein